MTLKMLVIGLDGACWKLINPWVEEGILPNIKLLKENGAWGDMESCLPPITCPAWKCYSTGKNPGKLGVFWWENLDLNEMKATTPSSRSFKSSEIWDYLNTAGYRTGVIGMPTTYPPKKLDGFLIAGGPSCLDVGYAYPSDLEEALKNKLGFKTNIPFSIVNEGDDNLVKGSLELIDLQFKAAKYLLDRLPVDFLQVATFHINGFLQHFYYDGEPVKEAWRRVDKHIGELMNGFEYVILMSDHGTSPMIKNYFLNYWLEKNGYLIRKKSLFDLLLKFGVRKDRIKRITELFGLKNLLKRTGFARHLGAQIPSSNGDFGRHSGEALLKRVDFERTRAVASPQGPLYINRKIIQSTEEYELLRDELIRRLEDLTDPETGKRLIEKVYKREDVYTGKYLDSAPDLIVLDADEYHNKGGVLNKSFLEKSEWKGNNSLKGLCLFYGPGINKNLRVEHVSIYDLAPTILHIYGLSIPLDMDGKVLDGIFNETFKIKKRDVKQVEANEKLRIKKALSKLKNRKII